MYLPFPLHLCRLTLVWFNVAEWKTLSPFHLAAHVVLVSITILMWTLIAVELSTVTVTMDNYVKVFEKFCFISDACVTASRYLIYWRQREELTVLIDVVNAKVHRYRPEASDRRIKESTFLFWFLSWCTIASLVFVGLYMLAVFFVSVITGKHFLIMALPFERVPYSPVWWAEVIFIQIVLIHMSISYTLIEAIIVDLGLQLAFLFRMQHGKVLAISPRDPSTRKFVAVAAELVELKKYA